MSANEPEPVVRMNLPPEGAACGVVFLVAFVGFFVALAVFHLATWSEAPPWGAFGSCAAVVWLVFVPLAFFAAVRSAGGWRASAIATLGAFSSRPFVEVAPDGDRTLIGFGFELFRRRFYYLRINREWITSVEMNSGQATALAGRDMDDWSVVLWYRDPAVVPPEWKARFGVREDELHIVGPSGTKALTAEFFAQFVAFLRAVGIELQPGTRENEFRVVSIPPPPQ